MRLDDADRKRLAQIERQLSDDDPKLDRALRHGRPPRYAERPWYAWFALLTAVVFAVVAGLLASVGWALFAAVIGAGWWVLPRIAAARNRTRGAGTG